MNDAAPQALPARQRPWPLPLRLRILLLTGGVLLLLLLVISQVLLHQWREVIITKQHNAVTAVSKTFAVTVIDALIEEEQTQGAREGVLQTYVDDFMRSLENVKYVEVRDEHGEVLAASPVMNAHAIPKHAAATQTLVRIFHDQYFAWVIEVREPLRIAGKVWGDATIGFDAAPIRTQVQQLFILLFATTMIVSCATLFVLFVLASRLTASLTRLVHEIDNVELDQDTATPALRTRDDVAFLFDRFERMKQRIEQSRTQIENAQRQVYHAEKLASIGRLASGVAHQVNNPLNGLRSCLYAIRREPENLAQTRQYLDLIDEEIGNIETVVQKLLGFARPQATSQGRIDVSASTRKVLSLLDLRFKEKGLDLELHLPENLPAVAIDNHLFQEVVMNLLLNSYDAVAPGGKITLTAGMHEADTVFLTVQDDGIGIGAADLPKVFEPFFTTKEIGTGTGLGLSVCQSIIENHGGRIFVESTEGQGATFTVWLRTGERDERSHH